MSSLGITPDEAREYLRRNVGPREAAVRTQFGEVASLASAEEANDFVPCMIAFELAALNDTLTSITSELSATNDALEDIADSLQGDDEGYEDWLSSRSGHPGLSAGDLVKFNRALLPGESGSGLGFEVGEIYEVLDVDRFGHEWLVQLDADFEENPTPWVSADAVEYVSEEDLADVINAFLEEVSHFGKEIDG